MDIYGRKIGYTKDFFQNMTIYKYQKIRIAKRNSTQQTGCKNIEKHVI